MTMQYEIPFYEKTTHKINTKMPEPHFHDKHELYYLEKGHTKYFIDNEIYILEPGDMIFVPKNTFHKTDNMGTDITIRVLFTFDDRDIDEDFSKYIAWMKENKYIKIKHEKAHHIQSILKNIESEEEKRNDGYDKMQMLYFKQLLILISRYSLEINHKTSKLYATAESISKYITENYQGDLSLEHLAQVYSISPSYLSRFFKTSTGVGLNEYINITRISIAEKLLSDTNMPITQIASECGFNDSNYFAAVFKKAKGITPKKYAMLNKK